MNQPINMQGIQNKLNIIKGNIEKNNEFISKMRSALDEIGAKVQQLASSRSDYQKNFEDNNRKIADLTNQLKSALQASEELKKQIATLQATNQATNQKLQQLQQLINEKDRALQAAQQSQQEIARITNENRTLQQNITTLDQQIEQITQLVATQTRLLNPDNSDNDKNLLIHVNGINQTLQSILNNSTNLNRNAGVFIPPGIAGNQRGFVSGLRPNAPNYPPRNGGPPPNGYSSRGGKKSRRIKKTKRAKKRHRKTSRK